MTSIGGTTVYQETFAPTTNGYGLVNLEIGSGTVVSGDFTTIDWANGPYFIETAADVTGGTSYSVMGTSQLMSVPYALHSKTADNIVGGITETDPAFTASEAVNITATDITNLSNLSGTNTGDQTVITAAQAAAITANTAKVGVTIAQAAAITANTAKVGVTIAQATILGNTSGTDTGDQTISRAGTTVTLTNGGTFTDSVNTCTAGTGITISASNVISADTSSALAIGDSYQGGIIFWLDASGQHGLIAATADQTNWTQLGGNFTVTNAVRDGIGAGKFNTERIIANQGPGTIAVQYCANYQGGNYGDWYLPSKYELNLLYLQKTAVGGFNVNALYWSSTEIDLNYAWAQLFSNGNQISWVKVNSISVRAIRAF